MQHHGVTGDSLRSVHPPEWLAGFRRFVVHQHRCDRNLHRERLPHIVQLHRNHFGATTGRLAHSGLLALLLGVPDGLVQAAQPVIRSPLALREHQRGHTHVLVGVGSIRIGGIRSQLFMGVPKRALASSRAHFQPVELVGLAILDRPESDQPTPPRRNHLVGVRRGVLATAGVDQDRVGGQRERRLGLLERPCPVGVGVEVHLQPRLGGRLADARHPGNLPGLLRPLLAHLLTGVAGFSGILRDDLFQRVQQSVLGLVGVPLVLGLVRLGNRVVIHRRQRGARLLQRLLDHDPLGRLQGLDRLLNVLLRGIQATRKGVHRLRAA